MNKKSPSLIIALILCFTININAQKLTKVKGNKNVIKKQTSIGAFHSIILDEDFDIEIIYNKETSIEIEADENLHEHITFNVIDSILTFNKTAKITSKKALKIKVNYNNALNTIETKDESKLTSLATILATNISLKTKEKSQVNLDFKADTLSFEGDDRSKAKLNLVSKNVNISLTGNSKLEAIINTEELKVDFYQRAFADIAGTSNYALLRTDNDSEFNGKHFTTNTSSIFSENDSEVTLEVTKEITIDASGDSSIYLYNDPKITINKLTDTSKIEKLVKK